MMSNGQPGFHRLYPKYLKKIQFMKEVSKQKIDQKKDLDGDGEEIEEEMSYHDNQCLPFVIHDKSSDVLVTIYLFPLS